jgi:outer membrane biosynthesis protein TonB
MAKAKKTKPKAKTKAKPKSKAKPKLKTRPKSKAKPRSKPKARAKAKPTPRLTPNYSPINCDMCEDVGDAYMTQGVNYTNIPGGKCTLTEGDTEWPFTVAAPISIPTPTNPQVIIKQGLNTTPPNNVYDYVCSCCPPAQGVHTVTVVG